jgi:DNA-binding protein HU-beta
LQRRFSAKKIKSKKTGNKKRKKKKEKKRTIHQAGFGTWYVASRKSRKGRNPKTGETITIPGGKVPKFKAGNKLKAAVKK